MGRSFRDLSTPRGPGASRLEEMGCEYDEGSESGIPSSIPRGWGNQGSKDNEAKERDSGKDD
jgi:hypothetical protein